MEGCRTADTSVPHCGLGCANERLMNRWREQPKRELGMSTNGIDIRLNGLVYIGVANSHGAVCWPETRCPDLMIRTQARAAALRRKFSAPGPVIIARLPPKSVLAKTEEPGEAL